MESLALLAALIVAPAMFGGPIALMLTIWNLSKVSKVREVVVYTLSSASILVGVFLLANQISPGARNIGIIGFVTGAISIWRLRTRHKID